MKIRESGMPDEKLWKKYFDIPLILNEMGINSDVTDLVEIGCGYGTFTIPSAQNISGILYGIDIEDEMLNTVSQKLQNEKIGNVILKKKDILLQTTGLAENSIDYVMLFNIMHHESPTDLLDEAYRILKPEAKIGIIHWRSDIQTPRGPALSIRPTAQQILHLIDQKRFKIFKQPLLLNPYHYGLIISKL